MSLEAREALSAQGCLCKAEQHNAREVFPGNEICSPASARGAKGGLGVTRLRKVSAFLSPQLPVFSLPLRCAEKRPENRLLPNKGFLSTVGRGFFLSLVVGKAYNFVHY